MDGECHVGMEAAATEPATAEEPRFPESGSNYGLLRRTSHCDKVATWASYLNEWYILIEWPLGLGGFTIPQGTGTDDGDDDADI